MKTIAHKVDFCVIGGGIAGICAALAAARNGLRTILVHDRPVPGGNASSEIRMWVCGARGENNRETGIIEELLLENLYRNPDANYSLWDSVLYGKLREQKNLLTLLNTSCLHAEMNAGKIAAIRAWELNAETWHQVEADFFADCSGDSILAPLTGAEFRCGREGKDEFNESIAPDRPDCRTMGNSCLIQARETPSPQEFIAPEWARKYQDFEFFRNRGNLGPDAPLQNYWFLEVGGAGDSLHDPARHRDELLSIAFGLWDLLKNHPYTRDRYRNWTLEWVGFLPGKRESRRYVGDLIVNQNDVRSGGLFEDIVAYGGWPMDDHHPDGAYHPGAPTIFHPAPSPWGIPYRALFSKNIENLFCAGRNISVTHSALSSSRVMATCGLLGHAVGVAAALAHRHHVTPRGVYQKHLAALQQQLMREDAYLPGRQYEVSTLTKNAIITAGNGHSPEGLRMGRNRIINGCDHAWKGRSGDSVTYSLPAPQRIKNIRIVFDSDLNRKQLNVVAMRPLSFEGLKMPASLVKAFVIEVRALECDWQTLYQENCNHRRVVSLDTDVLCDEVRLTIHDSWGDKEVRVFSFDIE